MLRRAGCGDARGVNMWRVCARGILSLFAARQARPHAASVISTQHQWRLVNVYHRGEAQCIVSAWRRNGRRRSAMSVLSSSSITEKFCQSGFCKKKKHVVMMMNQMPMYRLTCQNKCDEGNKGMKKADIIVVNNDYVGVMSSMLW